MFHKMIASSGSSFIADSPIKLLLTLCYDHRGDSQTSMRHSANLDILRSLAACIVLLDHLAITMLFHQGHFQETALVEFLLNLGHAGVLAFFVHTSLVLMYSLERMAHKGNRVTLHFYVRRFLRIYPLSVFCIVLVIIFRIPSDTWGDPNLVTVRAVFSNLLLVQNFVWKWNLLAPLWSLPYEVQMYLVLPALYFLTLRRGAKVYLGGLFLFFCICIYLYHRNRIGHMEIVEYVPCFLCGVLCYSLRDRIKVRVRAALWLPLVVLLILGYCLVGGSRETGNDWVAWGFCLLLGLAVNFFRDSSQKHLNFAAERIALYSYGLYLFHVPMLYLVFVVLGITNSVLAPLLVVALTFVGSATTYHLIESPFIELGRRLSSDRLNEPVQTLAQDAQPGS